jgi:septal ring factor EnvC (AmiA/AmiB activator)
VFRPQHFNPAAPPMANVLGILTAVCLALAAFVAFKNKGAYELEITNLAASKQKLAKTQATLKTTESRLEAEKEKRSELEAEVARLGEAEAKQKSENEEVRGRIDGIRTETAANKEKLDAVREKTEKLGDLKGLASRMRSMNTELEQLAETATQRNAELANLTASNNQVQSQIGGLKGMFERIASGQSLASLRTTIRSIYPSWGFVTLAAGNSQGVVANSTLDVVRDGEVIGKLLVTAVEHGSSTASIVPDSVSSEVTLMAGDQVVPGAAATTAAN